jgi:hypothetical protein
MALNKETKAQHPVRDTDDLGTTNITVLAEDRRITTVQRWEIAPETAETLVEVARQTHAIPAIEKTTRSKQMTIRVVVVGVCVLAAVGGIVLEPEAGWPIAAVVAVFGSGFALLEKLRHKDDHED